MTEDVSYKSGCLKGGIMLLKSYVQTASISTLVIFPLLVNQSSLFSSLHICLPSHLINKKKNYYSHFSWSACF